MKAVEFCRLNISVGNTGRKDAVHRQYLFFDILPQRTVFQSLLVLIFKADVPYFPMISGIPKWRVRIFFHGRRLHVYVRHGVDQHLQTGLYELISLVLAADHCGDRRSCTVSRKSDPALINPEFFCTVDHVFV